MSGCTSSFSYPLVPPGFPPCPTPPGSTEVAADCTWHEVGAAEGPPLRTAQCEGADDPKGLHPYVPAGRPIKGFRVVLLPPVREDEEEEEEQPQQRQQHVEGQLPPCASDELGASRSGAAALEAMMPVPYGKEGEVCVEGVGVAAGYLHGEEEGDQEGAEGDSSSGVQSAATPSVTLKTAFGRAARDVQRRRFIRVRLTATCSDGGAGGLSGASASLSEAPASLLFRTGDLGVILPSGELFCGAEL